MPNEQNAHASSPQNQSNTDQAVTKSHAEAEKAIEGADQQVQDLDFESLDLSAEAVDERISPSETNVFDK